MTIQKRNVGDRIPNFNDSPKNYVLKLVIESNLLYFIYVQKFLLTIYGYACSLYTVGISKTKYIKNLLLYNARMRKYIKYTKIKYIYQK
jgi:hypothetical protein